MTWQNVIDDETDYAQRVSLAKIHFSNRNKAGNSTFDTVKAVLIKMCTGPRRCAYCEDSVADEIEHIHPKDLYPEAVFCWENYVYACGPCNGPKNNKFSVLNGHPLLCVKVSRSRRAPVIPPLSGDPALINPRIEDPLYFLFLDLSNTFLFSIGHGLSSRDELRASYTCETLKLNRDYLAHARKSAFLSYRARLVEYIQHKTQGASPADLGQFAHELTRMHHRTVWKEMQRQRQHYPGLAELFAKAPEATTW